MNVVVWFLQTVDESPVIKGYSEQGSPYKGTGSKSKDFNRVHQPDIDPALSQWWKYQRE
jgi:hypothetical protein